MNEQPVKVQEAQPAETVFDCVVFSGGGAKGAYGAGAALAIERYRELKGVTSKICWIGASAGALNAAVMAMANASALLTFWREIGTRQVLNVWITWTKYNMLKRWLWHKMPRTGPYSIYSNKGLRRILQDKVDFGKPGEAHLIIAATNYTSGQLNSFVYSSVLDKFLALDKTQKAENRRLRSWSKLTDGTFVDVLLASCSIPICFPPIKINDEWYIDGGVGNNTPTREAAYFMRFLAQSSLGKPGNVFCVKLNPPRTRQDGPIEQGPFQIAMRAIDVFHHVHTNPIVNAWYRISKEVEANQKRLTDLAEWLETKDLASEHRTEIIAKARELFDSNSGATRRLSFPLHLIEPTEVLADTLDFGSQIEKMISNGYTSTLKYLESKNLISLQELQELLDKEIR
jgi:predicted acylesterase/phospholipase RssA